MQISASMVKELRERTGAGMMDCKKALQETGGDIEAAIDEMRKSGIANAAKKAGRIAAEGAVVVQVSDSGDQGVVLEVNCETDFVARDDNFQRFARQLAQTILQRREARDLETLKSQPLGGDSPTVEEARQQLAAKLGENISLRRFARVERTSAGVLGAYAHGIRIGALVDLSIDDPGLAKDLAMHIAAANPLCVGEQDMPAGVLEKEREIQLAKARETGKPEDVIAKMTDGRLKKFIAENTLLGQPFIKDTDVAVAALLQQRQAQAHGFTRYEVGEGIEKKEDNFAAEVMRQAGLDQG